MCQKGCSELSTDLHDLLLDQTARRGLCLVIAELGNVSITLTHPGDVFMLCVNPENSKNLCGFSKLSNMFNVKLNTCNCLLACLRCGCIDFDFVLFI